MTQKLDSKQQQAYDTIEDLMDAISIESTTTVELGDRTVVYKNSIADRVNAAIKELDDLNKKSNLSTIDKIRRGNLGEAISGVSEAFGTSKISSDEAQDQVLGGGENASAAVAVKATSVRVDAARVKEAISNEGEGLSNFRLAETQKIDFEDVEFVRSVYQHYLLYNTDFFSRYHQTLLNIGARSSGYEPPALPQEIIRTKGYAKDSNEPRIFLLSSDEESSIVNNKLSLCPGNDDFVNLKTSEYAHLQPSLRIYKVYRNRNGKGVDTKVEIEFRNKTGLEGIDSILNIPQAVGGALAAQRARGVECGVKSFDWRFLGTDPYTATRDIEATLVLHAQHFYALSADRLGPQILDSQPVGPQQEERYKYLDLVIQPDCSKVTSATQTQPYNGYYNPGCYEIQVDVGYAPQQGDLKDGICCQNDSLYLVHVDHKFDFKEDGTLDLTINYRGRLETIMNDKKFNVLLPGGGFVSIANKPEDRDTTRELIYKYNLLEAKLEKERSRQIPNEAEIKRLERVRSALFVDLRQYTYALILEIMEDQGMIHSINITKDHFRRFARWREPKFKGALPDRLTLKAIAQPKAGTNNVAIQLKSAVEEGGREPSTDVIDEIIKRINEQAQERIEGRLQGAVSKDIYSINYIYLGDLLSIVLGNTLGQIALPANIRQNVGTEVGGFQFASSEVDQEATGKVNPQLSKQITDSIVDNFHLVFGNIEIAYGDGRSKQVNLAHIPISLESFQDFMLKNVISQNTDYYSLVDFIDALVGDLVTDMFSAEHHVGLVEADARLSTTLFTSKIPLETSSIFEKMGQSYKEINTKKIDKDNLPFGKDSKCVDRQDDPYQYLVINTLNSFPSNLAGVYDVPDSKKSIRGDNIGDKNRGILHFTYGRDRGLLKSVQFAKTDQEYLPEARFSGGDGSVLNQLSNVYDASFNMIGNNIFKPGMLLYFNPEPMGVGQPWQYRSGASGVVLERSWANIMGIGGYHLITEVAHSIGPGKFDTSVKARWVNSGEDKSEYTSQELAGLLGIS